MKSTSTAITVFRIINGLDDIPTLHLNSDSSTETHPLLTRVLTPVLKKKNHITLSHIFIFMGRSDKYCLHLSLQLMNIKLHVLYMQYSRSILPLPTGLHLFAYGKSRAKKSAFEK
jgi:hypothetical protein